MTVWWKINNVIWSTQQLRDTGLIDHLLYVQYRPVGVLCGQLKLWIGKP